MENLPGCFNHYVRPSLQEGMDLISHAYGYLKEHETRYHWLAGAHNCLMIQNAGLYQQRLETSEKLAAVCLMLEALCVKSSDGPTIEGIREVKALIRTMGQSDDGMATVEGGCGNAAARDEGTVVEACVVPAVVGGGDDDGWSEGDASDAVLDSQSLVESFEGVVGGEGSLGGRCDNLDVVGGNQSAESLEYSSRSTPVNTSDVGVQAEPITEEEDGLTCMVDDLTRSFREVGDEFSVMKGTVYYALIQVEMSAVQTLSALKRKLGVSVERNVELEASLSASNEEIQKLRALYDEVVLNDEAVGFDIEELTNEKRVLIDERGVLQCELLCLRTENLECTNRMSARDAELSQKARALDDAERFMHEKAQTVLNYRAQVKDLEDEVKALKDNLEKSERRVTLLKREDKSKTAMYAASVTEIIMLKEQSEILSSAVKNEERARSRLAETIIKQDAHVSKLENLIGGVQDDNARLEALVGGLEKFKRVIMGCVEEELQETKSVGSESDAKDCRSTLTSICSDVGSFSISSDSQVCKVEIFKLDSEKRALLERVGKRDVRMVDATTTTTTEELVEESKMKDPDDVLSSWVPDFESPETNEKMRLLARSRDGVVASKEAKRQLQTIHGVIERMLRCPNKTFRFGEDNCLYVNHYPPGIKEEEVFKCINFLITTLTAALEYNSAMGNEVNEIRKQVESLSMNKFTCVVDAMRMVEGRNKGSKESLGAAELKNGLMQFYKTNRHEVKTKEAARMNAIFDQMEQALSMRLSFTELLHVVASMDGAPLDVGAGLRIVKKAVEGNDKAKK